MRILSVKPSFRFGILYITVQIVPNTRGCVGTGWGAQREHCNFKKTNKGGKGTARDERREEESLS